MKVLIMLFVSSCFFTPTYASVESKLKEVQVHVQKNKFPIYEFISNGDSFNFIEDNFSKFGVKLKKDCSRKISKLCFVEIQKVKELSLLDAFLVFYDEVLVRSVLMIDAKNKSRIEVVKNVLSNKRAPDYINYKTDTIEEKIKFSDKKLNVCNVNNENNSRLIKLFESLEWEERYFSLVLSTTHLRNYIDNSYSIKDCETAVEGFVTIQSYFEKDLEEEFIKLSEDL